MLGNMLSLASPDFASRFDASCVSKYSSTVFNMSEIDILVYAYAICSTNLILASQNIFGRPKPSKSCIKTEVKKIFLAGQKNFGQADGIGICF